MFESIWEFLRDSENRSVLGWAAGGICVLAAGLLKVFASGKKRGDITTTDSSITIVGKVTGSEVRTGSTRSQREKK